MDPNEFIVTGDICEIKLYDPFGKYRDSTIIDAVQYQKCVSYKWYIQNKTNSKQASSVKTKINGERITIQDIILNHPHGTVIDHIDGNPLNNRLSNLRICTKRQNSYNRAVSSNNTLGYKGVYFEPNKKLYRASIRVDGVLKTLKSSKDINVVIKAYDDAAIKYFGEYARTNQQANNWSNHV
jgi:hypothetical protein